MNRPHTRDWATFAASELPAPSRSAALASLRIQERMLSTAINHDDFASEVVALLHAELGLTAVSLFIRTRGLNAFKLKAAIGLDYQGYQSFLLPNPSYPSLACDTTGSAILVAFPPFASELYLNRNLLEGLDVSALVVVPFTPPDRSDTDYPDPLGALCLYAPRLADLDDVVAVSASLQSLIGTLYVASLERRCMNLRTAAVKAAAFESTLSGTANALIALMCQELDFDAGSLWLLDPRRQQLKLRAAYPSLRQEAGQLADNIVWKVDSPRDSLNPLGVAFRSLHKTHYPRPSFADGGSRHFADFRPELIPEDYGDQFHNVVAVPLRTQTKVMLGHVPRSAVGVVELTNKFTQLGPVKGYIPTTWEDLKLVSYMAEISAVLVFQGLQALDHEADYERRIHGLKTNLSTVRSTLIQLEERAQIVVPDSRMNYHLPNAIEWVGEMEQQVGRSDKIARLKVTPEPVSLVAVLSRAVAAARRSARACDIENFAVHAEGILAPGRPAIRIMTDPSAFQTVFRNLFENTRKYRDKNLENCVVEIWAEPEASPPGQVQLFYSDNGIGIRPEDFGQLFEYGYRGRIARRVNVQGEGIGLHECQQLMQATKGDIRCASRSESPGATFVLTFPLARGIAR